MKNLILAITILIGTTVSAQNWSLVMPNDTLVYHKGPNNLLYTVWVDSIDVNGTDTTYFMNQISPGKYIGPTGSTNPCQEPPGVYYSGSNGFYENSQNQFCGNWILKSGNKWTIKLDQKEYVVYPESSLFTTWVYDSVTNDSAYVSSISPHYLQSFGVNDSIKYIRLGMYELSVSKNHGIVVMNDFRDGFVYINSGYHQVGVQNQGKGTTVPMGMDFFHFLTGDRFYYHRGDLNNQYWYEEVVSVATDLDTIIYTMNNGSFTFERKYWPTKYPILNNMPNTLGFLTFINNFQQDFQVYFQTKVGFEDGHLYKGNTIYRGWNSGIGTAYCGPQNDTIESFSTSYSYVRFEEGLGMVTQGVSGGAAAITEITGFIRNGDTTGTIVSGEHQLNEPILFNIHPNPCREFLTIETGKLNSTSILEMYDLRGRLISTKTFERDLTLDVSSYQRGIYFAIIKDNDGVVLHREKIVVQ